jgi:KDO2-lipid IV(A) lauroyltransferase
VVAFTASFNEAIEKAIRRAPEQWFWLHERWKTRPRPEVA